MVVGDSLIPEFDLTSIIRKNIEKYTNGYKTGLKIVVTYTSRGGFTNTYSSWNEKCSSVVGKEYCRGNFKKSAKVKSWY